VPKPKPRCSFVEMVDSIIRDLSESEKALRKKSLFPLFCSSSFLLKTAKFYCIIYTYLL
jgi:hypothetical protein